MVRRVIYDPYHEFTKDENGNIVKPKVTIHNSTMTRATQTADIIHTHLPDLQIKSCDLLPEGAPCPPDPPLSKGNIFFIFYQLMLRPLIELQASTFE